jgi:hypothetical protein
MNAGLRLSVIAPNQSPNLALPLWQVRAAAYPYPPYQ